MAHAAVISLKYTLQSLHLSDNFSILDSESKILDSTLEEIDSLQQVLEILDERNNIGWKTIKEWELVESQMLKHFPSQYPIVQFGFKEILSLDEFLRSTTVDASDVVRTREAVIKLVEVLDQWLLSSKSLLVELERVKQEIYSFAQTVKMINDQEKVKENDQNKSKDSNVLLSHEFPKLNDLIKEIREYAEKVLMNLKTTVKRFDKGRSNSSRERVNALEVQIREAVCDLEDLLDIHVLHQILNSQLPFPINLHKVERWILHVTQLVKKLKEEYMNELMDPLLHENENDDDIVVSRESSSCQNKCKMVGFHNVFVKIKGHLMDSKSDLKMSTLYGMAGIGKTMVASKVFEDPSVLDCFELRVWVDVGQNYKFKRIMQSIIAQVSPHIIDELLTTRDEILEGYLHKSLNGRRYLIVLDDVWDGSVYDDMRRFFPNNSNKSRVLVTTRLQKLARYGYSFKMRFLRNEESWDLLREKVFGKEPCPSFLRDSGIKIAESCDGLPLTIVTVGKLLSKVNKEPNEWKKLAMNPNPLLEEAYEQMLEVLRPSYNNLPRHELKACFLYMGVFPRNYVISRSEITKLWAVDKVFEELSGSVRIDIFKMIEGLGDNSILMPGQWSSTYGIKIGDFILHFGTFVKRKHVRISFSMP